MELHFIPDVMDCTNTSCNAGGTCQDTVNGITCECPSGYSGTTCEIGKQNVPNKYEQFFYRILLTVKKIPLI